MRIMDLVEQARGTVEFLSRRVTSTQLPFRGINVTKLRRMAVGKEGRK